MYETNIELRRDLLLHLQVALLGMVPPNLRAVTLGWSHNGIEGKFYFDGPVSSVEQELVSEVETEVIAGFPDHAVEFSSVRFDAPDKPPILKAWVYYRQEEDPNEDPDRG